MTTVLLIHPGAVFSTADVYAGVKYGLEVNGCTVVEYRLDAYLQLYERLVDVAIKEEVIDTPLDATFLASKTIVDDCVRHDADLVLAISGTNLHMAPMGILQMLSKQKTKKLTTALLCTESPYDESEPFLARVYDHVFTNEKLAVNAFTFHAPSHRHYLPHAYHPLVHTPHGPALAAEVFFVGTGFPEREQLFGGVDWSGIDFRKLGYGWGQWAELTAQQTVAPTSILPNAQAAAYYRGSQISLNHHRTITTIRTNTHIAPHQVASLGPRAYEISACGGFQLCDDSRAELHTIFGESVPTYRADSSADLARQIHYYLRHPEARDDLARAQAAAVQPHHWGNRASELLSIVL